MPDAVRRARGAENAVVQEASGLCHYSLIFASSLMPRQCIFIMSFSGMGLLMIPKNRVLILPNLDRAPTILLSSGQRPVTCSSPLIIHFIHHVPAVSTPYPQPRHS